MDKEEDELKKRNSEELLSPTFSPAKLKFPKHIHTPMDDKFKELADTILNRSVEGQVPFNEVSAPYELASFPIEQNETKNYFERQYSRRNLNLQIPKDSARLGDTCVRNILNNQEAMIYDQLLR